jgi:hypothetical protein
MPEIDTWSRGVTVSTLDPESSDRGSNPRATFNDGHSAVEMRAPSRRGSLAGGSDNLVF